jgi:uncharacterized protein
MIALLDVNVLVALFDPTHIYHDAAHVWFGLNRQDGWATCPLTENAFVRVLSNPAYRGRLTTLDDAASRLKTLCAGRDHVFWPDSLTVREASRFHWRKLQGHRQLTDVYLLALAISNHGCLATFDARIPLAAIDGAGEHHLKVISVQSA